LEQWADPFLVSPGGLTFENHLQVFVQHSSS
jgi:hypothetical protein